MTELLASIIIPCYNAERWVETAIQSALSQTYRSIEVIVVDDGSIDGSINLIRRFDGRVKLVRTANRGPSSARNIGLQTAQGQWIQFLDADDILHPDKLRLSIEACEGIPGAEYAWAPYIHVNEAFSLGDTAAFPFQEIGNQDVTTSHNSLSAAHAPWAAVFRRSLLERVGNWNEALKGWEDFEYHARIAAQLPLYARLSQALYFYRDHSGERTGRAERTVANIRRELDCLLATRVALEASTLPPPLWKEYIWITYPNLARSFGIVGDREMFERLLTEAAELRGSPRFRLKCYLAIVCARTIGLKPTCALLDRFLPS